MFTAGFSLPIIPLFLLPSADSCHSLHTMDQDYYEGTDFLSPVPADGERTEDFEYEVGLARQTGPLMQLPVLVSFSLARCTAMRPDPSGDAFTFDPQTMLMLKSPVFNFRCLFVLLMNLPGPTFLLPRLSFIKMNPVVWNPPR